MLLVEVCHPPQHLVEVSKFHPQTGPAEGHYHLVGTDQNRECDFETAQRQWDDSVLARCQGNLNAAAATAAGWNYRLDHIDGGGRVAGSDGEQMLIDLDGRERADADWDRVDADWEWADADWDRVDTDWDQVDTDWDQVDTDPLTRYTECAMAARHDTLVRASEGRRQTRNQNRSGPHTTRDRLWAAVRQWAA
jgi:hypothetical protein